MSYFSRITEPKSFLIFQGFHALSAVTIGLKGIYNASLQRQIHVYD